MLNVLFLLPRYLGDHEVLNLQARLDPARFRVVVAYLSGVPDGADGMERVAARVVHLGARPHFARWSNPALVRRVRRLADEEAIDVLACHQHRTVAVGVLAARGCRKPPAVVAVLHGLRSGRGWGRRLANAWIHPRLARLVAVSDSVAADVRRADPALPPGKVTTVHNGIDPARHAPQGDRVDLRRVLLPGGEGGVWFGTAGRLVPGKNHVVLLEAFARVAISLPDARLLIAGTGPQREALQAHAGRLGIQRRVAFLGFRRDLPAVLQALDVFVLPSLREGFGLALVEAMAAGCVVVAGRVGAVPEVVGDGAFARLVDPAVAAEVEGAMHHFGALAPGPRQQLGALARERALSTFAADRMVAGYERVFLEASAGRN